MSSKVIQSPPTRSLFKSLIDKHKTHKVFVKFQASWCGPCNAIEGFVKEQFNKVPGEKKVLIIVDVDRCEDVASYFRIRSLPTLMSFKDGERHNVVTGADYEKIEYLFKHC
jgi:thioredoxin 1